MILLTVNENWYMNLLRPIISSLVNKNYYVIILFLRYVFLFASKDFVFLNFKLERMFKKKRKKIQKIFQSIFCRMDKLDLFVSANVLLFDVLTIWIHHFVLFFSILSQKSKFYVKKKNNTHSSCMIFFPYFMLGEHIS